MQIASDLRYNTALLSPQFSAIYRKRLTSTIITLSTSLCLEQRQLATDINALLNPVIVIYIRIQIYLPESLVLTQVKLSIFVSLLFGAPVDPFNPYLPFKF